MVAEPRQIDQMFERGALRARNRSGEIIPTWEVGREQLPPYDLAKQAKTGYTQNSLIYSCIYEKQTSFATVAPQLIRPGGELVENHRLVRLLRHPAPGWNWQRFQSTLIAHLDVGGNVYIEKIRESADLERRRMFEGYPVQELRLIRPDKVTIEPGQTSATDVFVVTVGGRVRKRIPRRDMIHIHEESMISDYYGLSKIGILAREGSIDLAMSDMELAFFRNAGVPAGLLTVKGTPTTEQMDEIKSRFRETLSGFKRWFEVLILNDRVTDYKPLALKQSEMSKPETRAQAESRICGVLGVPGRIVGALFALGAANSAGTYEQDQFQFWTETIVPVSELVAGFYKSDLLPEFATSRDREAVIAFDFSKVRALQEDNSRKLREVVRMINTGGVMVSTAFQLVGLPSPPDSDFFVRSANQAEVRVLADGSREVTLIESTGSQEAEEPNPLEGAASYRLPAGLFAGPN